MVFDGVFGAVFGGVVFVGVDFEDAAGAGGFVAGEFEDAGGGSDVGGWGRGVFYIVYKKVK